MSVVRVQQLPASPNQVKGKKTSSTQLQVGRSVLLLQPGELGVISQYRRRLKFRGMTMIEKELAMALEPHISADILANDITILRQLFVEQHILPAVFAPFPSVRLCDDAELLAVVAKPEAAKLPKPDLGQFGARLYEGAFYRAKRKGAFNAPCTLQSLRESFAQALSFVLPRIWSQHFEGLDEIDREFVRLTICADSFEQARLVLAQQEELVDLHSAPVAGSQLVLPVGTSGEQKATVPHLEVEIVPQPITDADIAGSQSSVQTVKPKGPFVDLSILQPARTASSRFSARALKSLLAMYVRAAKARDVLNEFPVALEGARHDSPGLVGRKRFSTAHGASLDRFYGKFTDCFGQVRSITLLTERALYGVINAGWLEPGNEVVAGMLDNSRKLDLPMLSEVALIATTFRNEGLIDPDQSVSDGAFLDMAGKVNYALQKKILEAFVKLRRERVLASVLDVAKQVKSQESTERKVNFTMTQIKHFCETVQRCLTLARIPFDKGIPGPPLGIETCELYLRIFRAIEITPEHAQAMPPALLKQIFEANIFAFAENVE
jgi:hypothetical protein